nr:MAG TPA: hypothetical protein [Caudoviricetes sp.]
MAVLLWRTGLRLRAVRWSCRRGSRRRSACRSRCPRIGFRWMSGARLPRMGRWPGCGCMWSRMGWPRSRWTVGRSCCRM